MKKIFITSLILFIVGCSPVNETYYKPIINGGYYKTQCGGPNNNGAEKLNDKLTYFVYVNNSEDQRVSVNKIMFIFRVKPNSVLNFTSNNITLTGSEYNSVALISSIEKRDWKKDELKLERTEYNFLGKLKGYPETNLPAWTWAVSEMQKWGGFYFEFTIPPYFGSELSLKLPSIMLDGKLINPEILKVKKVTEHHMTFIC